MRLIFLHAFPLDGRMWNDQLGLFPGTSRAPALYRLGDSMEAWASGVLAVAGDSPLIVVGSSMGASCALEMARLAGDCIAGLVLMGSKAEHRPEPAVRDHYVAVLREGGAASVWQGLADRFFDPTADRRVVETAKAIAMEQCSADLIRATEVFHSRPDATDVVSSWRKPLVVVGGDCDGFVSVAKSTGIADSAPNSQLHIMRGCGHFPNMERPTEFNAILADLVRSVAKPR